MRKNIIIDDKIFFRDLQVPQIWQNKFASIRSGPKPVKNHQSVLPANVKT